MWDMLWEAAAISDDMKAIGKATALGRIEVARYLREWGRPGDTGVLTVNEQNEPIGAAWYRVFREGNAGYGFIAEDIPELTIGVLETARGKGAGKAMLDALLDRAKASG